MHVFAVKLLLTGKARDDGFVSGDQAGP